MMKNFNEILMYVKEKGILKDLKKKLKNDMLGIQGGTISVPLYGEYNIYDVVLKYGRDREYIQCCVYNTVVNRIVIEIGEWTNE